MRTGVIETAEAAGGRRWFAGLDGVRAIAVVLVFLQHYATKVVWTAGWTGVQVFFVLSGFLITGILYDSRRNAYCFRNFYIRRTLRIFPLFYFAWLMVLAAGWIYRMQWHPMHWLWVVYLGNVVRFLHGGLALDHIYTANPQLPIEIGHFWSLAVEEQFYLMWPLVVFFAPDRRVLMRICVGAVLLVPLIRFALYLALPRQQVELGFLYRVVFTQSDSFLLGGALALGMRGPEKLLLLGSANRLLLGALMALALAYLANFGLHRAQIPAETPWMSIYGLTLVNLASAGLILGALREGSLVYRITSNQPMRTLGKYSYGFYVYHVLLAPFLLYYVWPVDMAHKTIWYYVHVLLGRALYFAIVTAISALSYRFVEAPFLALKDRWTVASRMPVAVPASDAVLYSTSGDVALEEE